MKLSLYNIEIVVSVNKQEGTEEASLKQRFILGILPSAFLWPLAILLLDSAEQLFDFLKQ